MSLTGFEVEVERAPGTGLATEEMTLNMGPQHPSTHGVLRFVVKADGEVMIQAIPDVGYLHRSIEKISEKVGYHGFMPYTDRVDYVAAMFCNQGWGMVCEKLGGIEVPKRGEYCRVIAAEFNRIASHLLSVGTMVLDIGAATPFFHAFREREKINDLLEELCGARLTYNYMRIGGVAWDLPPEFAEKCLHFLAGLEPMMAEYNDLITVNKLYLERCADVAVISAAEAINYNLVGPNLRASGVKYDVRRDLPYSVYPELEFDVPIGRGEEGTTGDSFDRYICRIREIQESIKILRQCFKQIPDGPVIAKVPRKFKPPAGDAYVRVESARGDMGWYAVSDGTEFPYRCKIRTGSFAAMAIIDNVSRGLMLADLVTVIASLDIVAPEVDR
ncbi:MAG: NADH-quinone oxidoreductase subunit D [Deltaproteobacteria bacterium]|nr:NADH-quinone oxidoreductase subunit D [Deltaproteobacteria bacterium]MBI3388363.1 NADH-quinone oxidoreductase subunit D [Deltaproteobacteria bacterium]